MDIQLQIKETALNMLARREHSQFELKQKLIARYKENVIEIESALFTLIEDNYQSDQRFCESFIRYRQRNGYGKMRILSELKLKGVSPELINQEFNAADIDWFELALSLKVKKFGELVSKDYKTRSKQYRYLQYRGFTSEQINYAIQEEFGERDSNPFL